MAHATGRSDGSPTMDAADLEFCLYDWLDAEALTAALDALLDAKPHLAARRARGDLGQHERRDTAEPVNLASMLRANT